MNWVWVFVNELSGRYLILEENEFDGERRYALHKEGFDCFWDSAKSRSHAKQYMMDFYPEYQPLEISLAPVSFRDACQFVNTHHRHHCSPQGMKFALALSDGDRLIGVLIAGRPVARHSDNGYTLEITRLCVISAFPNACSSLYAAARRIARDMGYRMLITYTLIGESGSSLKATGFTNQGVSLGGSWNSASRCRKDKHPTGKKSRWELSLK